MLGIVAARRGDFEAAEARFVSGMKDARECEMYLLELLCARDVKQFVLEAQGRASEADVMIEEAAAAMNKTKSDFVELLAKRRMW